MPDGPDPLGKRALYWLPVDEQSVEGDGYRPGRGAAMATDTVQLGPDRRHARPAGKHALFSAATPAGEDEGAEVSADDPLPPRGVFVGRLLLVRFGHPRGDPRLPLAPIPLRGLASPAGVRPMDDLPGLPPSYLDERDPGPVTLPLGDPVGRGRPRCPMVRTADR